MLPRVQVTQKHLLKSGVINGNLLSAWTSNKLRIILNKKETNSP